MRTYFLLLLFFGTCLYGGPPKKQPWGTSECHRAFLLGMGSAKGALTGHAGLYGFWPHEKQAAEIFFSVAKLYAEDIGVSPQKLATDEWAGEVAKALEPKQGVKELSEVGEDWNAMVAYITGAYVRWGTLTGFRMNGHNAYGVAQRIGWMNQFNLQLVHVAGYPGGITITVSDGGETPKEEFFKMMHDVEAGVKEGMTCRKG